MQYANAGALSVTGIDISEKMLEYAKAHNMADNINYYRLAFADLDNLNEKYDVITSSLAFDYVEDFRKLMITIYSLLDENGVLVFSMSHPLSTAYDGVYNLIAAGFIIEECQESKLPDDIMEKYYAQFHGILHQPDFIFSDVEKETKYAKDSNQKR